VKHLYFFLLVTAFFYGTLFSIEQSVPDKVVVLTLKGYLSKEKLAEAKKTLSQLHSGDAKLLVIELDTNSGDIIEVLDLAKVIYEEKVQRNIKVIVFIEDNAIGAGAVLPYLADELYISLFVSWGDIPLGSETVLPTNILRNRVVSLIASNNPHAQILSLMAAAMTDSSVQIVDDNGWKIETGTGTSSHPVVSARGQTLVVNQNQLKQLGLVEGVLSATDFRKRFPFSEAQQTQLKEEIAATTSLAISEKSLEERLKAHIKYDPHGPNQIGHIIVEGQSGISQSTWLYVKTALDHYKQTKPIFVILELNTPGGEVFASQEISDALKSLDTQYNIPVIAFINNWAISAGAMLAYSCRFIAVVKDGSIGAAEPVIQGSSGELQTASEKINSALRADFANRARFFDRNPYIAEAMVDKDTILVLRHGQILKLDNENQIRTTGTDPDIIISHKGKLLTLNAEQAIKYGVADLLLLPQKLEPITPKEQEEGKWPASKMLLFHYPFFENIPNAVIDSYRMDWKTHFFVILAHPMVSSLLFLGMLLGFYMEINTPGFGLAGTLALTCLFLIVLSSLSLEIANWLELIFLLTGVLIILVELFILPTFGLLGFIGILLFIVGLFGMMLPGVGSVSFELDTHSLNAAGEAFFERLAWLCGTVVLAFVLMVIMGRFITPSLVGFRRFVLTGHEQEASQGYIAGENPHELPQPGSKGEVIATLRPAGKVIINDMIYDAISEGSFIEKGAPIVVARLDGSVIVVEKISLSEGQA